MLDKKEDKLGKPIEPSSLINTAHGILDYYEELRKAIAILLRAMQQKKRELETLKQRRPYFESDQNIALIQEHLDNATEDISRVQQNDTAFSKLKVLRNGVSVALQNVLKDSATSENTGILQTAIDAFYTDKEYLHAAYDELQDLKNRYRVLFDSAADE